MGQTEIMIIIVALLSYLLPATAVLVIIWLLWNLLKHGNRTASLESRVERLERLLNKPSEPVLPDTKD